MPMLCDNYIVKKIVKKQFEHEDFIEILRSVGLCLEQYEKLSKVKTFNKFSENNRNVVEFSERKREFNKYN